MLHHSRFLHSCTRLSRFTALACLVWFCGAIEPATAAGLKLVTFRVDVTPPLGSPLVGGWVNPLIAIDDPLWAKGIVLDEGGQRYVLCAVDYCEIRNSSHTFIREQLAAAAGTDASRVAVHSLHQHTAPMIDEPAQALLDATAKSLPSVDVAHFHQAVADVAKAVRQAVEHLEPCDGLAVGAAEVDRFASNRRVMGSDGKIEVRYSSTKSAALQAAPEGLVDRKLRTITFLSGQRQLARLHYYATHPQSYYGDGHCTSDTVGLARERLETEESVPQIYFTGCSGDITAGKYNDGSPEARRGSDRPVGRRHARRNRHQPKGRARSDSMAHHALGPGTTVRPSLYLGGRARKPRKPGGLADAADCKRSLPRGLDQSARYADRAQLPFDPVRSRSSICRASRSSCISFWHRSLAASDSSPWPATAMMAADTCAPKRPTAKAATSQLLRSAGRVRNTPWKRRSAGWCPRPEK